MQDTAAHEFNLLSPFTLVPQNAYAKAQRDFNHFIAAEREKAGKGHHVRKWQRRDLQAHFAGGHLGVTICHGRKIVAQALLTLPDRGATKFLDHYPFDAYPMTETAVIQSVGVHPLFRGSHIGLSRVLLDWAAAAACDLNRRYLIGKTAQDNPGGLETFKNAGFARHGKFAQLPGDAYVSAFMTKKLNAVTAPRFVPALQFETPVLAVGG